MRSVFSALVLLSLWSWTTPSSQNSEESVIVAVIDTGIDTNNKELSRSLWNNPGEIPGNGIDDDGNGLIDDVHGWNFCDSSNDIIDKQGHGTHVAGIIHKEAKSRTENTKVRFMTLKYSSRCGESSAGFVNALNYAIKMGAQVINISGGGFSFSKQEVDAVKLAHSANIPIVSASGNKRPDEKHRSFFPAAYSFSNVFSVVATDSRGESLDTSNINPGRSNLFAEGKDIVSFLPGNKMGTMTGTSQAAASITGRMISVVAGLRHKVNAPKVVAFYSNPNHSW